MKKLLTYTAFAAMMLTACAPDEHEDINIAARPSRQKFNNVFDHNSDIFWLHKLISYSCTNLRIMVGF